jgi:mono/diheme cytochrome c family protein
MIALLLRGPVFIAGETALGLVFACATAAAQSPPAEQFAVEQVKKGADIFAQNCSPCHGARMADPNGGFDLRTFPHEQKNRFVNSVTKGKNSMPPWGDLFKSDEIDALWAYVVAGERE